MNETKFGKGKKRQKDEYAAGEKEKGRGSYELKEAEYTKTE